MSATRKDFAKVESLQVQKHFKENTVITAVQSATIPTDTPGMMLYLVTSEDKVQFLPAEASNEMRDLEFVVLGTSSNNLVLKNASGDVKVIVPPGGYGSAVCIRGVWYGKAGNVGASVSLNLGAAASAVFNSMASGAGFAASAQGTALVALVNNIRARMIAAGLATS